MVLLLVILANNFQPLKYVILVTGVVAAVAGGPRSYSSGYALLVFRQTGLPVILLS